MMLQVGDAVSARDWMESILIGAAAAVVALRYGKQLLTGGGESKNGWRGETKTMIAELREQTKEISRGQVELAKSQERIAVIQQRAEENVARMVAEVARALGEYTKDGRAAIVRIERIEEQVDDMHQKIVNNHA